MAFSQEAKPGMKHILSFFPARKVRMKLWLNRAQQQLDEQRAELEIASLIPEILAEEDELLAAAQTAVKKVTYASIHPAHTNRALEELAMEAIMAITTLAAVRRQHPTAYNLCFVHLRDLAYTKEEADADLVYFLECAMLHRLDAPNLAAVPAIAA